MKSYALGIIGLALAAWVGSSGVAGAQNAPKSYPTMVPFAEYAIASREDEVSLARSAAPPSISANASVLVLGPHGYDTAANGTNGWVCLVGRSWFAGFEDPIFWNPKLRAPICFNPIAVRTELPRDLKRTEWVLAGLSKAQMIERTKAAIADGTFKTPELGALSYMLSKGTIDPHGGPWLPHLMFYLPRGQADNWGAGKDGSPIIDGTPGITELDTTLFLVPVRRWSDGTPGPAVPLQPMTH